MTIGFFKVSFCLLPVRRNLIFITRALNKKKTVAAIPIIIENPVNQATGNKILSAENKVNGAIVTSNDNHRVQQHGKNTFTIKEDEWFTVKDDIFNNDNWRPGKNE